jgi:hypothetical protein
MFDVIRSAIATPAASSAAELMRNPVDKRSIDVSIDLFTADAAADAINDPMFVLMFIGIFLSFPRECGPVYCSSPSLTTPAKIN